MEGVELEFRDDALRAVAKRAMKRKTGARGLRTILESVLLDTMYDLPSSPTAKKVVLDEAVVIGRPNRTSSMNLTSRQRSTWSSHGGRRVPTDRITNCPIFAWVHGTASEKFCWNGKLAVVGC